MNDPEVQQFKERLLELKSELLSLAETANDAARPVQLDQSSVGRLSRMDAIQGQQMAQEALRRRASQLVRIDGALRRIGSGDFGFCHVCGKEIDPRRLQFDPTTTRCVSCKEA